MLSRLASTISENTPTLKEIIEIGDSLKDTTSLEELTRAGATILTLLEPFLDALLPEKQVSTNNAVFTLIFVVN